MPELKNLDDLFVHTLRRVYDAEQRLTKALPKMAEAAEAQELKQAFQTHVKETETHIDRIDRLFGMFNRTPNADTDDALKGIVKASEDVIDLDAGNSVKDAALVAAAQEAEHYEIAVYGTLRTWAQVLAKPEAVQLLERTLEEEKRADQKLTAIAGSLNSQAAAVGAR
jgi:ferritin-like metal-binding protein YciE